MLISICYKLENYKYVVMSAGICNIMCAIVRAIMCVDDEKEGFT